MTLQVFSTRSNRVNLSAPVPEETNFIQRKNVRRAGGVKCSSWCIQEREDTNFENSVEKTIGCAHLRLDMCTSVRTSLASKITRLHLLSDLGTTFHTRNTQSTDTITSSGFSKCPCKCILTPWHYYFMSASTTPSCILTHRDRATAVLSGPLVLGSLPPGKARGSRRPMPSPTPPATTSVA
jgi:hypothetical protein